MQYIDNNITFSNVKDLSKVAGIADPNTRYAGSDYDYDANDNPVAPKFLINAIDIDWNGANFGSALAPSLAPTTINTTGDLINAIKWASLQGSSGISITLNGTNRTGTISFYAPTASGEQNALLMSGGNGQTPFWGTLEEATTSLHGLMSSSDKEKLDELLKYVLPSADSVTLGGIRTGYNSNHPNYYPVNVDSETNAYVYVPWTDTNTTLITTSVNETTKQAVISDSFDEKFKIKFTSEDGIAYIKVSDGQNHEISTALPGIRIDGRNRKMIGTNAAGEESSIQFGGLDIIAVFLNTLSYDGENNRYWATMYLDSTLIPSSGNYFDEVVYIGDLILAPNSTDSKYHLYACYETTYVEELNPRLANAYFVDLGVFPGDNITLDASKITVTGIRSEATGGNDVSDVQAALGYLLYYNTVSSSDVAGLED